MPHFLKPVAYILSDYTLKALLYSLLLKNKSTYYSRNAPDAKHINCHTFAGGSLWDLCSDKMELSVLME